MKKLVLTILISILLILLTGCSCKHEETKLVGAVQASCMVEGYTGDVYCLKCEKVVQTGQPIPATGHTAGEPQNAFDPNCTMKGYTGDVYCTVCNELLEQGSAISKLEHEPGKLHNTIEPSCTSEGYSGDTICVNCGMILDHGEAIPMLEHTPDERQGILEPSCTSEGYTGDIRCAVCGTILEQGNTISMLEHVLSDPQNTVEATCLAEGYTGDCTCTVCGTRIAGEPVAKLPHSFQNNICSACGWKVPGLYIDGALYLTWAELEFNGYVTVKDAGLVQIAQSLMGQLVVDESITHLIGTDDFFPVSPFYGMREIESIYLPYGITSLGNAFGHYGTFGDCSQLQEVRAFGQLADIGTGSTFINCSSLRKFEIPEGVTNIGEGAFQGCTSLEKIVIPSSVQVIGENAFANTPALKQIDLPEGLLEIGQNAFEQSGFTEITLPSTVRFMRGSDTLEMIDASACSWEEISDYAFSPYLYNDNNLREIRLPNTLKSINYGAFSNCASLETLVLPDGFQNMKDNSSFYSPFDDCDSLKVVVWPTSLIDGTKLAPQYSPNLKLICYKGSEQQWQLTTSKDLFHCVRVLYNYDGATDASYLLGLVKEPHSLKVTHKSYVYSQSIGDKEHAIMAEVDDIFPCTGETKYDAIMGNTYYKVTYNGNENCWINIKGGELLYD